MLRSTLLAGLGAVSLMAAGPETESAIAMDDVAEFSVNTVQFPEENIPGRKYEIETSIDFDSFDDGLGFEYIQLFTTYDDFWNPVRVLTDYDREQITCIADNLYHEARGEPREGQIAVVDVVFNRVEDSRWPSTPCEVIYQRAQFSWTLGRRPSIGNEQLYQELYELSEWLYLNPEEADITGEAQYYHATYVRPRWSYAFDRTRRIDMHIFYRQD